MPEGVEYIILVFMVLSAVAAVWVTDLLAAVAILGAYSFFLALFWAIIGAVDVSFTEAMVGAGVSTVFFVVTLLRTDRHTEKPHRGLFYWSGLGMILFLGGLLGAASLDLPAVGDALAPANVYLSPDYLKLSWEKMHTANVVTAILADFRSFDTLIETVVVFTAGVACFYMMRRHQ